MKVIIAKNAGFCFGVKRAIEEVRIILDKSENKVYSIGALIHNEKVVNELKDKGLIELNDVDDIKNLKNEVVIIRTHGIEKELYNCIRDNGNEIIDLTCPFVKKIHDIVEKYTNDAYNIIVIGDKNHPEVRGIMSYGSHVNVVLSENDIKELEIPKDSKVLVVSQTTADVETSEKLVDILRNFYYNIDVINTICNTTIDRQEEVKILAKVCDVMLIVGSTNSSNTVKLYNIAKTYQESTYIISDKNDLESLSINKKSKVGICAGASTPQYLIEEIVSDVRNEF